MTGLLMLLPMMAAAQQRDGERLVIRLADRFDNLVNEIPPALQADSISLATQSRNNGFRIQILNTRDVRLAESVRAEFDTWMSGTGATPPLHSYVLFRQPFYRVHVGDFRDRSRAQETVNRLKDRYPDAWVVIDQIVPERVRR
jgi:hypothetical protein